MKLTNEELKKIKFPKTEFLLKGCHQLVKFNDSNFETAFSFLKSAKTISFNYALIYEMSKLVG
jgi:hypothetical protein